MNASEKSLELNIIAELSCSFRRRGIMPVVTGLSLLDEADLGYDAKLDLGWRAFFLQFKRAHRRRRDGHTFYINNDSNRQQHASLLQLPGSFYAFPRLFLQQELLLAVPFVTHSSLFVNCSQIGFLLPPEVPHRVKLFDGSSIYQVFSESEQMEGIEGKDFVDYVLEPSDYDSRSRIWTLGQIVELVRELGKRKWANVKRELRAARLLVLREVKQANGISRRREKDS